MKEKIRLDKYFSLKGVLSRREAKTAIEKGLVKINGEVVRDGGIKIQEGVDTVEMKEKGKSLIAKKDTVLVYKPRGVLSSKDTTSKNIFEVFPQFKNLNCVGRLDKESEGLILLSNDGLVTKAVTGKDHRIEKEYVVKVQEDFLPWMAKKFMDGVKLRDGIAKAVFAKKLDRHRFSIVLRDGRKHQIRRMANKLKLTVKRLERVRIGEITKRGLRPSQFRKLSKGEITQLKKVGLGD